MLNIVFGVNHVRQPLLARTKLWCLMRGLCCAAPCLLLQSRAWRRAGAQWCVLRLLFRAVDASLAISHPARPCRWVGGRFILA